MRVNQFDKLAAIITNYIQYFVPSPVDGSSYPLEDASCLCLRIDRVTDVQVSHCSDLARRCGTLS